MKKKPEFNLTPKEEKQLSEWIKKFEDATKQIVKLEKARSRYKAKAIALAEKALIAVNDHE